MNEFDPYPVVQPTIPWEDDRVQVVYKILADSEAAPPEGEHWEGWAARRIVEALYDSTPAALWRTRGEPDPHPDLVDRERAQLPMGQLTDDQLADAAFMNYDQKPSAEDLIFRRAWTPLMWMTAVKERVRWLSRQLVKRQARIDQLEASIPHPNRVLATIASWVMEPGGVWFAVGDLKPRRWKAWQLKNDNLEITLEGNDPSDLQLDFGMWSNMRVSDRPEGGKLVTLVEADGFPTELQTKLQGWMSRETYVVIARGTVSHPMRLVNFEINLHDVCLRYRRSNQMLGDVRLSFEEASTLEVRTFDDGSLHVLIR